MPDIADFLDQAENHCGLMAEMHGRDDLILDLTCISNP